MNRRLYPLPKHTQERMRKRAQNLNPCIATKFSSGYVWTLSPQEELELVRLKEAAYQRGT